VKARRERSSGNRASRRLAVGVLEQAAELLNSQGSAGAPAFRKPAARADPQNVRSGLFPFLPHRKHLRIRKSLAWHDFQHRPNRESLRRGVLSGSFFESRNFRVPVS